MSAHCHFSDDTRQHLRQIQRQMRLLDLRLQLLRERMFVSRLHRPALHCCCLHQASTRPQGRRAITARLDLERRMDRMKRLSMMLNSSCNQSHFALIDVKDFDPRDITVMVKDGKVMVLAEHKEQRNTAMAKTCNYRKFVKEFNLPPGVNENEVTYSLESNSLMKIEMAPKGCPCHSNY